MTIKTYGSVSGQSKEIKKLYGSVNGQSKEIKKLYASVNGVSKLIYQAGVSYGIVYYKATPSATTVQEVEIASLAEFNSLVGTSSASLTSVAINGVTLNATGTNVIVGLEIGSEITSIPNYFLKGCAYFNQALTIPSGVSSIGNYFLSNCTSFNSALTLSSTLTTIGANFLTRCGSFNQALSLPSSLTSIGSNFIYICINMTSYVNVGSLDATIATSSNYSFAANSSTAACYATGIKIRGANRAAWMTRFPNRTSSPYRKLVDYGS